MRAVADAVDGRPMSELSRIRERLRQNRAARRQTLTDTARETLRQTAPGASGTVTAGDRVFDVVSGEEGEVVTVTRENLIVPTPER